MFVGHSALPFVAGLGACPNFANPGDAASDLKDLSTGPRPLCRCKVGTAMYARFCLRAARRLVPPITAIKYETE